jgi:hypothetical protein
MVTASNAENFANITKHSIFYCSSVHYHLLKPQPEGNTALGYIRQENGLQKESR